MSFEWATELLFIRMSRPFAANQLLTALWQRSFTLDRCFGLIGASTVWRSFAMSFWRLLNIDNSLSICNCNTGFPANFELGRNEWFALRRLITKLEMLHIPGFLKFCSPRNLTSRGNRQREGFSAMQRVFENLQRCANSSWQTDGPDHNRNNNSSMWPDNVLTVLCYSLAALPTLKVS